MNVIEQSKERRAQLFSAIDARAEKNAIALAKLEQSSAEIVKQIREENEAADAAMRSFIVSHYGEPSEDDVEVAKNQIEASEAVAVEPVVEVVSAEPEGVAASVSGSIN